MVALYKPEFLFHYRCKKEFKQQLLRRLASPSTEMKYFHYTFFLFTFFFLILIIAAFLNGFLGRVVACS